MPRPPAKASTVGVSGQQATATTQVQPQTVSRMQQQKEEQEMQRLQLQQMQQMQQLQQQQHMQQLQQQQAQLQQQSLQYTQGMGSGTLGQSATANNLVSVAVQAATNAANAAATAGGATAGGGYAFPRNSPEFACENVGERVKGKRRKYCPHEVTALVLGVQRYADDSCPWSSILRDPHLGHLFHGRSGVDLKDKWRTLIKTRPELAAYTENRKNHRKYRPFSATEERALLEGVKKYNGQRNVWSLILIDKELGPQFNDRSNVQLKDKFRTMRRAGTTSSLLVSGGGGSSASRRTLVASTPTSTSPTSAGTSTATSVSTSSSTLTPTSSAVLTAAVSAAGSGTSRPATVTSASQQAATLLVQNSNAASAMFADPNLYLAGAFSMPPQMSQGMSIQHMTSSQSRQQVQAQAQAHAQAHAHAQAQAQAQAQAIANAQARAAQVQLEAQMQQMRGQQHSIKQQYQTTAFSTGIPGYQLVGNQIVPQQALYYPMGQNTQSQQQAHLHQQHQQQQLQQQLQQRQLQQQQQQQQLAAAIAAATNPQHSQHHQHQQKSQPTSAGHPSATSLGASGADRGRERSGVALSDKPNDPNSIKGKAVASSSVSVEDLLMQGTVVASAGSDHNTRTI